MIIEKVKDFLVSNPQFKIVEEIDEDTNLIESGILDSFSVVRLMMFVEKEFGIRVEMDDLAEDNIESLKSIERMILSKLKTK